MEVDVLRIWSLVLEDCVQKMLRLFIAVGVGKRKAGFGTLVEAVLDVKLGVLILGLNE